MEYRTTADFIKNTINGQQNDQVGTAEMPTSSVQQVL